MSDATARLLWASAHLDLPLDEVRAALSAGADVERASTIALSQHVGPLLHRTLQADGVESPTALSRDAARSVAHSRIVLPTVGDRVLRPLADAGIEAVVIKGGALAPRYPDAGLRPMDDVDLLAPPDRFDDARAALVRAGWRLPARKSGVRHETTLTHPEVPGLAVDLHREWATWRSRSNHLSSNELWQARRSADLYGAPAFVLAPEEEIVMLAAHASKPFHNFDRLIWIVDLVVLARAADLDWDRVASIATRARCRVALAVGLTQAQRIGLRSPESLRTIRPLQRRTALAELLSDDWPVIARTPLVRDRARYAVVDDRRAALSVALGEAFGAKWSDAPFRTARVVKRGLRRARQRRHAHTA